MSGAAALKGTDEVAELHVPKGYKQTEIGLFPADWEIKTLCEIAVVSSGKRLPLGRSLSGRPTPHPYIRVSDMRPGTVSTAEIQFVPADVYPAIKRYRIFADDIFISVAGTLGIVGVVPPELDGANLTENADRISNIECSRDYLLNILAAPLIQNVIEAVRTVGAQPKLALERIRLFRIPLPPTLPEQQAIAKALGDADELLEGLESLIAKKRAIKQGAMQELLTGKRRLPGFKGEWKPLSMREVLKMPATYGIVTAGSFVSRGVEMVRGGDINDDGQIRGDLPMVTQEKAAEYKRTTLEKDDVVVALVGYPGAAAKIPERLVGANISRAVGLLRFNTIVHADFMVCLLNSPEGRRMVLAPSAGSAQQVVNLAALNKLEFRAPSTDEQLAISTLIVALKTEIETLHVKLAKARQVRQGMMQELLTGRIRLV